jgi:TolA-binding protein
MLEVDPRSAEALFGLGQILAARGDHNAAIDTFKTYIATKTTSQKG